jgi:acyl-CoA carboxylase epsilon subunit
MPAGSSGKPGDNGAVGAGAAALAGPAPAPVIAVVAGSPTTEEIAALVAVLRALAGPASAPGAGRTIRSEWSARSRLVRQPLARGPGGWRASALPR